jgi:flagellum-specific ATP synthase
MVCELQNHWSNRRDGVREALAMEIIGRITGMTGLIVEVEDFPAPVGANCQILTRGGNRIPAEAIGFRDEVSIVMPLGEMTGISCGDRVRCVSGRTGVPVGPQLLGRVIDGQGRPIDGKGPLLCPVRRPVESQRIEPLRRRRIDTPLGTGVRAIDGMTTCGRGQRMGIFSGPGVGKSVLLGMIARYTAADVTVIGLVGERGREVRDFIEKDLGVEGLRRSVVVVSTSDEPAPLRVRAGFVAATVAEYFRDQGRDVLLLMDSVTRIAMAQRQIGLSRGEPPATKGYTPSVFALLPKLLERCGLTETGSITGFFTVLVESDDLTEPISDAMRSILDGHLWLSRDLANRGHYPAIDVLGSISRVMTDIADKDHLQAARRIIRNMAVYRDIEDLVNIGAYAAGSSAEFDLAIRAREPIQQFLAQTIGERTRLNETIAQLKNLARQLEAAPELNRVAAPPVVERKNTPAKSTPAPRTPAGRVTPRPK